MIMITTTTDMPNSSWLILWWSRAPDTGLEEPGRFPEGGRFCYVFNYFNSISTSFFKRHPIGSVTFSIISIKWITFFKRHLVNLVVLQILNYLCPLLPAESSTSSECIDRNSNAGIELDDNLKTPSPSVSYFAKNISISISEKLHLKCKDQGTSNALALVYFVTHIE